MIHLQNILKASLQDALKMSWRRLEDVLKTSWQDILKMSWRRLEDPLKTLSQDVLKTSSKRLEDVLKTSWRRMAKMNIWFWSRRLEDVFWRRMTKVNIFVLIKTSSRRLLKTKTKGVFKTSSSRRMFTVLVSTSGHWMVTSIQNTKSLALDYDCCQNYA